MSLTGIDTVRVRITTEIDCVVGREHELMNLQAAVLDVVAFNRKSRVDRVDGAHGITCLERAFSVANGYLFAMVTGKPNEHTQHLTEADLADARTVAVEAYQKTRKALRGLLQT